MMRNDPDKQREADRLEEPAREARALAEKLGLKPFDVNYWIVDHDEMNELVAYGGFQTRYPHWRWGMKYDRQRKQRQYLGGKAFELVNNDNPAHAFLQESNALADQKAVITHVEAHSDFFANNQWFGLFADSASPRDANDERAQHARGPNAAAMLERHSNAIAEYLDDPEVDRDDVERFIDTVLTLEDNIEHRRAFDRDPGERLDPQDLGETLSNLGVSEEVRDEVFDQDWLDAQTEADPPADFPPEPEYDVLAFLRKHGQSYDSEAEKAVEFENWQRSILEFLRRESYYFAPQQMTKVMNEGWAAYWESMMMGEEAFATDDEFLHYADHQAMVLNSPGFNPYQLGKQLWEYVENQANRREVLEHLLCVDGITPTTFHDDVDFEHVLDLLEPPAALDAIDPDDLEALERLDPDLVDYETLDRAMSGDAIDVARYPWKVLTTDGLAVRHYSLVKPQCRGFLQRVSQAELEEIYRYQFEVDAYETIEAAIAEVDRTAGWDRLYQVRESHNDVTFIDEFLTQEFVEANDYFTYEHSAATGNYHATSSAAEDVKKKLLLRLTNLGKPRIGVYDANHGNAGELLLRHEYNGVILDMGQAEETLKRVFELWGRPVNLHTITKRYDDADVKRAQRRGEEPEPEEVGLHLRYDGDELTREELDWADVEDLAATDLDYDTKPEDWL